MRYRVSYDNTKRYHATKGTASPLAVVCYLEVPNLQCPLSDGDRYKARVTKTVLYGGLEGIGTTELRICDDEANSPVDSYR